MKRLRVIVLPVAAMRSKHPRNLVELALLEGAREIHLEEVFEMPCFRALGKAAKRNANRAAKGKSVTIGGRTIKASTYKKKYGLPKRLKKR